MRQADLARAFDLSRQRICALVKKGMPTDSLASAKAWRRAHYPLQADRDGRMTDRHLETEKKGPPEAPSEEDLERSDIAGVKARAIAMEREAYTGFKAAQRLSSFQAKQRATRLYKDACAARLTIEKHLAELLAMDDEYMTMDQVRQVISEAHEPVRAMLEAMPAALAQRVNPAEPEHARVVIEEEVQRMMARVSG